MGMPQPVSVTPKWSSEQASRTLTETGFRQTWQIVFGDGDLTGDLCLPAMLAPGLPKKGQSHARDAGMIVVGLFPRRVAPLVVEVEIEYGPASWGAAAENPMARPPQIEWSYRKSSETPTVDFTGKPLMTTAGEPFEKVPPVDIYDLSLSVDRNTAAYDKVLALAFAGAINNAPFAGFPAYTAKLDQWTGREVLGQGYWQEHLEILFRFTPVPNARDITWIMELLNAGFRESTGDDDGSTRTILNQDGEPVSSPWPLDAMGQRIEKNADGTWKQPLVYLPFRMNRLKNFAELKLSFLDAGAAGGTALGISMPR